MFPPRRTDRVLEHLHTMDVARAVRSDALVADPHDHLGAPLRELRR